MDGEGQPIADAKVGLTPADEMWSTADGSSLERKIQVYERLTREAACDEEGLIVRSVGHSLVFVPPLIISEAEIDDLIDRFGAAWDRTIPSL